jgi:RNA polymerase sigma-B factor
LEDIRFRDRTTEQLLALYRNGGDRATRDAIIERHAVLVRVIARKFTRAGVPIEDLVQCAWMALTTAVDRFDPVHGVRLETYAAACMAGEIKRYFRDRTWVLKVPRHLRDIFGSLQRSRAELQASLGREPVIAELALALGTSVEDVAAAMELGSAHTPRSLDDPIPTAEGSRGSVSETQGALDSGIARVVEYAPIHAAIRSLESRDQRIIQGRFLDGLTQSDLGVEFGVSQMQVSRLERRALRRLREILDPRSAPLPSPKPGLRIPENAPPDPHREPVGEDAWENEGGTLQSVAPAAGRTTHHRRGFAAGRRFDLPPPG